MRANEAQIDAWRTVKVPLANQPDAYLTRHYELGTQDEDGDGTVPHRSGIAPVSHSQVQSALKLSVGHEPAFKDSELAKQFTLRAIVQIAAEVTKTSLHYA